MSDNDPNKFDPARADPFDATAEVADSLRRGRLTLIDVREPAELPSGRIKGARNIPLGQLGERIGELHGGKTVAFVCQSGARSTRATRGRCRGRRLPSRLPCG